MYGMEGISMKWQIHVYVDRVTLETCSLLQVDARCKWQDTERVTNVVEAGVWYEARGIGG